MAGGSPSSTSVSLQSTWGGLLLFSLIEWLTKWCGGINNLCSLNMGFVLCTNFTNNDFATFREKVEQNIRMKRRKEKDYIYVMLALNIAMIMWKGKEMMVKNQIYCFHGGGKCDYIDVRHGTQEAIWICFIIYIYIYIYIYVYIYIYI
jgi:hypothetical protein